MYNYSHDYNELRLTNLSTYPSILFPTCRSRYQVNIHSVNSTIASTSSIHLALFRRQILLSLHISLPSPSFLSLWTNATASESVFAINASSSEFVGAIYCKCRCIGNSCSPHNSRNYSPYPFSFRPVSPLPTIKIRTSRLGKWILTIIFLAANDSSLSFKILFEHGKGYHARSLNGTFSATLNDATLHLACALS